MNESSFKERSPFVLFSFSELQRRHGEKNTSCPLVTCSYLVVWLAVATATGVADL